MTVTIALALTELPAASVAVNSTVVSPIGNVAGASFDTVTAASTLSLAVACVKNSTRAVSLAAIPSADDATKLLSAGADRVGAV